MHKIAAFFFLLVFFTSQLYGQTAEQKHYSKADSSLTDSLAGDKENPTLPKATGLNQYGLDIEGFHRAGPNYSNELYSVFPNLPMIHFNRVNGIFLGVKQERMQWQNFRDGILDISNIHVHGMLGYATGLEQLQYSVGLEKVIGHDRNVLIGGELFDATGTDDHWRVGLNETSFTSLVAGYDYLDYYNQSGWGSYLLMRGKPYFEGGIAFTSSRYGSLSRNTNWALFGAGERYRENPPLAYNMHDAPVVVETATISSLFLSAAFNPEQLVLHPNFTFKVTGTAELADPGIGKSQFSYSKFTGELVSYLKFEPGGVLKHRLRSSAIRGEAPSFKQLYLGGIGTMRALPYKMMGAADRMMLSNLELQFGHPGYLDDFYLSLFLDSGWVDEEENRDSSTGFKVADIKHNAGVGLGTNLIRGEIAWDLDRPGQAPVLWVRLNPTF